MNAKERRKKIRFIESVMSNKEISMGCRFFDMKYNEYHIVSYLFTAGWIKKRYDPKSKDEYYVCYIWYTGDQSIAQVLNNCENLGHPLTYWDLIYFVDKNLGYYVCPNCYSDNTQSRCWESYCVECKGDVVCIEEHLASLWRYKNKTIWEQEDRCIEFLYMVAKRYLDQFNKNNYAKVSKTMSLQSL